MKKVILSLFVAASFAACNNTTEETDVVVVDSPAVVETPAPVVTYVETDGDVKFEKGKVMVYKGGAWTESKADVTLDNGVVVTPKGEVKKDGKVVTITEGGRVSRTGDFWDNTGNKIDNAWDATVNATNNAIDATKEATNKAVDATKEGLKKAGDKLERAGEELKK